MIRSLSQGDSFTVETKIPIAVGLLAAWLSIATFQSRFSRMSRKSRANLKLGFTLRGSFEQPSMDSNGLIDR